VVVRRLRRLALLTLVVLAGAWLANELPFMPAPGLGLLGRGRGREAPLPSPAEDGDDAQVGAVGPPEADGDEPSPTPDGPRDPDLAADDGAVDEPDEAAPPEPARGAGAQASVTPQYERFRGDEPVIVMVTGTPTAELTAPTSYRVELQLDGKPLDPQRSLALSPAETAGAATAVDLRLLAGSTALLRPGRHSVAARLIPADGGASATSTQVEFDVLGPRDGGGNDGGGQEADGPGESPPAPDTPEPGPSQPPPDAPPPAPPPDDAPSGVAPPPPAAHGGDGDDAPSPPTPEVPGAVEAKLVVPVFGPGEEVTKQGPSLVLVPGGRAGNSEPPRPLASVLAAARRRAEEAVDRAGARDEDRDLVRR
jgi:hypothetical protein